MAGIQKVIGGTFRWVDRQFGVLAWLIGEPRQPVGGFDLEGEKFLDWGWICTNLPHGPHRSLEIGCGKSPIISAMLALGHNVTAVDQFIDPSKAIGGFAFIHGDFNDLQFAENFDVIVLCSVVEHVGLSGRYNSMEDSEGDLRAMEKVASLLSPDGLVFLTIPVGVDALHHPWHRVYGEQRLPRLLDRFKVAKSRYLIKQPKGQWNETSKEDALSLAPDIRRYALGQFILKKTKEV